MLAHFPLFLNYRISSKVIVIFMSLIVKKMDLCFNILRRKLFFSQFDQIVTRNKC